MLTLRNLPDLTDNQYWEHAGNGNFVLWPADDGDQHVVVRISTTALSKYDGDPFTIDIEKTTAALERQRGVVQQRARSKDRRGEGVITLDVGDFPSR
jgi:hypothetical protein